MHQSGGITRLLVADVSGKPVSLAGPLSRPLLPEHRVPYLLFRWRHSRVTLPGARPATINIGDARRRRSIITVIAQRKVLNRQLMGYVTELRERMYAVRCRAKKWGLSLSDCCPVCEQFRLPAYQLAFFAVNNRSRNNGPPVEWERRENTRFRLARLFCQMRRRIASASYILNCCVPRGKGSAFLSITRESERQIGAFRLYTDYQNTTLGSRSAEKLTVSLLREERPLERCP